MVYIDLRSDTVTKPTDEMREAMARAEVGDDVYGEDPTVNRLQEMAAERLGKEAALFVPTGTMGNQLCVKLHTRPGEEVVVEELSHMYNLEMAGAAAINGVQPHPVRAPGGILDWPSVAEAIRPRDTHFAQTGLIALENTQNLNGGTVMSLEAMREICEQAHQMGIPVHLDGARIFNAATALRCDAAQIAAPFDSVMFCISKGLGAPVGSLVVGPRRFIDRAIPSRRMLGGAMRQVGVLAAAGIVALEKMTNRLGEDHEKARLLATGLARIPEIDIDPERSPTNIVVYDIKRTGLTTEEMMARLKAHGVLATAIDSRRMRMVTHKDVAHAECEIALSAVRKVIAE
jgi:threonine aldolase